VANFKNSSPTGSNITRPITARDVTASLPRKQGALAFKLPNKHLISLRPKPIEEIFRKSSFIDPLHSRGRKAVTSRAVVGRVRFEPVGEEFLKFATEVFSFTCGGTRDVRRRDRRSGEEYFAGRCSTPEWLTGC